MRGVRRAHCTTPLGRGLSWSLGLATGACQLALGFQDHHLDVPDGGLPQSQAFGGAAGNPSNPQSAPTVGGTGGHGNSPPQHSSGGTASTDTGSVPPATAAGGTPEGSSQTAAGGRSDGSPDSGVDAGCDLCAIRAALVHRYSFDGSGTQAVDSVGKAHGVVVGTQLSGSGTVVLSGSGQYVALPSGIVSSLTDATFEAWITWQGGAAWQRVFDFGSSNGTAGISYLFLTPEADHTASSPRVAYTISGPKSETRLNGSNAFPTKVVVQVALSFNATDETFSLFVNGAKVAAGEITGSLAAISDTNNWLGHSQFSADPDLLGTFDEFRIYQEALSPSQLEFIFGLGPDATFQ